jgi:hypothetical protein
MVTHFKVQLSCFGCPNKEIREPFLFKGLILRKCSYFGVESVTYYKTDEVVYAFRTKESGVLMATHYKVTSEVKNTCTSLCSVAAKIKE